jgi:carboxymethylenebutenolidase
MARTSVTIDTKDGRCEASLFRPSGSGPWPAVIMYMDGVGIRAALFEIGERIAAHDYVVLLPDLFYRAGPYVAPDPAKLFSDPALRAEWFSKYMGSASQANVMSDTRAFLDFLSAQADVKGPKIGTTGYCMGGGLSLAAAGHYPDRVAAAASFHGARLATDAPDSVHLLAPKMKAKVYVAGAIEDAFFPDDQKQRLDDALTAAGVDHTVVTYEGARHGWVPSDTPVHNPAATARHYEALFALLDSTLAR